MKTCQLSSIHARITLGTRIIRSILGYASLMLSVTTAFCAVDAALTPPTTTSASTTPVVLQITGLTNGESVTIERFVDANSNGTLDTDEFLFQRFTVTDGQVTSIGGIRNSNIPGDEDLAANGQISVTFTDTEFERLAGAHTVRISSPGAAFAAFTKILTVNQTGDLQSISGTVMDGTNPVPHAAVYLLTTGVDGEIALGAIADASGVYSINAPVREYQVCAVKAGKVANFGPASSPIVNLTAGLDATNQNPTMTPATTTITGTISDASTSAGIGGIQMFIFSLGAVENFTVLSTNPDGTYTANVTAGNWAFEVSSASPNRQGYLGPNSNPVATADTTSGPVTGTNIQLTPSTALIYGTVTDPNSNPLSGIEVSANNSGNTLRSEATTNAAGQYVVPVNAGRWNTYINSSSPGISGFILPNGTNTDILAGQAIQVDFMLTTVSAHIQGTVTNLGNPVSGITVIAYMQGGGSNISAVTAANGTFDLGLGAGTWQVALESSSAASFNVIGPTQEVVVAENQTVSGVSIAVITTTQTISGVAQNTSAQPINANIFANATIGGTNYSASAQTDGSGNYSLPVINGTWSVGGSAQGYDNPNNVLAVINDSNATVNFTFVSAVPEIAVEQPSASGLVDGGTRTYGTLPTGESRILEFTIKNLGTANLTGLLVTKDGSNAADFTVNTSGMASSIAAGGSTTFSVTFAPTGFAVGTRTAAIHIASNDADENPFDIGLSGEVNMAASLDNGFGTGGKVTTAIGSSYDRGRSVAVQADGKIILVGETATGTATGDDFAMARYLANGTLDTTFGTNGFVVTPFAGSLDWARAVAIQDDGKIVVAGHSGSGNSTDDFAVARYLSNGTLDTTFSGDGVVTVNVSGGDGGVGIAIQDDGKIVVVGYVSTGSNCCVMRFDANGVLDTSFNTNGIFVSSFDGTPVFNSVAIQPDGKIVAAGYTLIGGIGSPLVARLNTNGTLDSSFGTGGKVNTNLGTNVPIYAVGLQQDGSIVMGGAKSSDFMVMRYDGSGNLDTTFGGTGVVTANLGGSEGVGSLVIQSNGKIILAGSSNFGGTYDFAVVRYNTNGTLDNTFNGTGSVLTPVGTGDDTGNCIALQADGAIVVGGIATTDGNQDFALVRYAGDSIVPEIAVEQPLSTGLSDGGILSYGTPVGGSSNLVFTIKNLGAADLTGLLVTKDGSNATDFTIDASGMASTIIPGGSTTFSVTFAPTGYAGGTRTAAIHIASNDEDENPFDIGLSGAKNVAASLDNGFGTAGKVTTAIGSSTDWGRSVAVQADGKIILVGETATGTANGDDFAMARYLANGTLDTTFGTNGFVVTPFAGSLDKARAVAIQDDGKIVVAGHVSEGIAVARYLPNGTLDSTYSDDGVITVNISGGSVALGTAIQDDGKIVVVGYSGANCCVMRFDTNGVLDTSFNTNGIFVSSFGGTTLFTSVAIQPNGKIVAAGYSLVGGPSGTASPLVARLNTNGTLDSSFGTGGKVNTNLSANAAIYAVAIQPNGSIVIGGANLTNFMVMRYDGSGILDTTFGGTGVVTTNLGGSEWAQGLVIQPNGKIVLAGASDFGGTRDFAVVRYNTNGTLDSTFNGTGSVLTPVGNGEDIGYCIALQADGAIVVGGVATTDGNKNFALVRYAGDQPKIVVEQPVGNNLTNGAASIAFGAPFGINPAITLTIRNFGGAPLAISSIAVTGGNTADFTVNTTGTLTTVQSDSSTTFTVVFTPTGLGNRTTTLRILNNDANQSTFDITLNGKTLVATDDTDGDGLNDVAEFQLSALGFNWQVGGPAQTALVNALMTNANDAELYTPSQVQALNIGTPLLQRTAPGQFKLTIGVEKSTTLLPGSFNALPIDSPGSSTSINGGKLEFQFTVPDNAAFFRLQSQ